MSSIYPIIQTCSWKWGSRICPLLGRLWTYVTCELSSSAGQAEKLSYAANLNDASEAHSALQRKALVNLLRTVKYW